MNKRCLASALGLLAAAPSIPSFGQDFVAVTNGVNCNFDPLSINSPYDEQIARHIFTSIFTRSASGYIFSNISGERLGENGCWQINIPDNFSFTNGDPILSADIKFSIDSSATNRHFNNVTTSTNDDKNITICHPNLYALTEFLADVFIVSASAYEENQQSYLNTASGEFSVESCESDVNISLIKRNDTNIRLSFRVVQDSSAIVAAMQSGEADVTYVYNNEMLENLHGENLINNTSPPSSYFVLYFSSAWNNQPLEIRKSIGLSLNRDQIEKTSFVFPSDTFGTKRYINIAQHDASRYLNENNYNQIILYTNKYLSVDSSNFYQTISNSLEAIGVKVSVSDTLNNTSSYIQFLRDFNNISNAITIIEVPSNCLNQFYSCALFPSQQQNDIHGWDFNNLIINSHSSEDFLGRIKEYNILFPIASKANILVANKNQNNDAGNLRFESRSDGLILAIGADEETDVGGGCDKFYCKIDGTDKCECNNTCNENQCR